MEGQRALVRRLRQPPPRPGLWPRRQHGPHAGDEVRGRRRGWTGRARLPATWGGRPGGPAREAVGSPRTHVVIVVVVVVVVVVPMVVVPVVVVRGPPVPVLVLGGRRHRPLP